MTDHKTISHLANTLKGKKALDPSIDPAIRFAACVQLLRLAGKSVSPSHSQPRKVLAALANIEKLAGFHGEEISRRWLAVRALGLADGERVGGEEVLDDAALVFILSAGGMPTTEPADNPRLWLGADPAATIERASSFANGIRISSAGEPIFAEPTKGASAIRILDAIEALPSRRKPKASSCSPDAVALEYDLLREIRQTVQGNAIFSGYKPSAIVIPGASKHPTALVESTALASIRMPLPSYRPMLDPAALARGTLSDIQLETVIYAGEAHQRRLPAPTSSPRAVPPRMGFLIGHGAGVGKSLCITGIIMDNRNQGRTRAVWISDNLKLFEGAQKNWCALGGKASDVFPLHDFSPMDHVPSRPGILFVTFALLRQEERLAQIVNWLGAGSDGVVVFDESQNGRNAVSNGKGQYDGANQVSQQGEAMLALQERLPNARVVYSSATSAGEISQLGYAARLPLWGPGTSFATHFDFISAMEKGGIAAMELVARDLKALGLYMSASLSFDGVEYERMQITLDKQERDTQDAMARTWTRINVSLQRVLDSTGLATMADLKDGKFAKDKEEKAVHQAAAATMRAAKGIFRQARGRFFQSMAASIKTKRLLPRITADLARGHSPIVQIMNTYEANFERALAKSTATNYSDVDLTTRDILLGYVNANFPIVKHGPVRLKDGSIRFVPLYEGGKPVIDPKALAERDATIAMIEGLDIPACPLDQLIDFFGTEVVAEVTGRSKRLVPGREPGSFILEKRTPADIAADISDFQGDRKRLLALSAAGMVGADFHAAAEFRNQRQRIHYLVQPGWRADLAVQGLGRSHRSGQVKAPRYVLVQTDLFSDRQMVSVVASGMEKLGAITRGQRHAAAQELFTANDNLESHYALKAWKAFIDDLFLEKVPGLNVDWFERETGLLLRDEFGCRVGDARGPTVRQFLAAMSGMTCDRQELFGQAYRKRLEETRIAAMEDGTFDRGVEWIKADSVIKVSDEAVWRDPATGATTRLLEVVMHREVHPTAFAEARKLAAKHGRVRIAVEFSTNRVAVLGYPEVFTLRDDDEILVATPTGVSKVTREELYRQHYMNVPVREAERLWEIELGQASLSSEVWFHMVTGLLLPIWHKLPDDETTVWRMETMDGEELFGRIVSADFAERFRQQMRSAANDPDEALAALKRKSTVHLADGWIAFGYYDAGSSKVMVDIARANPAEDPSAWVPAMKADGAIIRETKAGPRFTLPSEQASEAAAWAAISRRWPVMSEGGLLAA